MPSRVSFSGVQRNDENDGDQESAGGEVPNPGNGPAKKNRAQRPNPRGEQADLCSECAASQSVNGDPRGGGENALEAEDYNRGSSGVQATKTEDKRDKIRINGRDPCGRAGVYVERRAESFSANNVRGDAADFHPEGIVGMLVANVSFLPKNESEAQNEAANKEKNVEIAIIRSPGRRRGL